MENSLETKTSDFQEQSLRKQELRPRDCPIPGCKATSLLKLADHLRCTHHIGD